METTNMDSVFANANDADIEFDTMFDTDDNLIDTVNGVNEAGDPLTGVDFSDLHQEDDEKDNQVDPTENAPETPIEDDTSVKNDNNDDSKVGDEYKDSEDDYNNDKDAEGNTNPTDIEGSIDKVASEDTDEDISDDDISVDDIEDELEEAAIVDTDVTKVDDSDCTDDEDLIDAAAGTTTSKDDIEKLAYDTSDEELIDMAINGSI